MAEPTKEQFGDGQDNLGQAASKAAEAARLFHEQAAAKGTEMAVNTAAASVQAGLEGGSAVANVAAGTAAGGPWGAAISAAWAMRHTLYKILICVCLFFTVIIVLVVALPSIVTESVFGLNGTQPDPNATLESSYTQMADAVSAAVEAGYDQSLAKVEQIIADGGYDYNLSMDAMINHAQSTAGYDVAYILAAYSASLQQKGTSVDDMVQKLQDVGDLMFPVTYVEKEQENLIPVSYCTYKPQTVTVVTAIQPAGVVNGVAKYNYTTEQRTYYVPDETLESDVELTIDSYRAITVTVPIYSGGKIIGVEQKTYYKENGTETVSPTIEIIKYVECTIHPFDNTVIADAFGIDMAAEYPTFKITYGEAIQNMANALKMTLYGSLGSGSSIPLTDSELIGIVNQQTCNDTRKHILTTALSLVGKVPYFWGGKSAAGWNDEWNTPKLVTAAGSTTSGTIRPFGLDCSGFTDWTYKTAVGVSLYGG
ncbi:MAG: hypothetical protein II347_05305, partial [Lachnospiraceae bacterium]|nr:hypothetical protein [Lachnospiraceae bacterium]